MKAPDSTNDLANKKIYKKASFWQRFFAFIIDYILASILLYILESLFPVLNTYRNALQFIILALYGALFITYKGATPGKMIYKLRVVTLSYEKIHFWRALYRESIGKYVSDLLFAMGYFWMLIDDRKQAWHDKIAKTLVVKLDDTGKLIPVKSEEQVTKKSKVIFASIYVIAGLIMTIPIVTLFLFRPFQISGSAMAPNYVNGQYYFTNIQFGALSREDVVIFKEPDNPNKDLIKRVIGLPGDTILLRDGNIYLNGQPFDESKYIPNTIKTYGGNFLHDNQTITVPLDKYFVLGDNRPYSSDSREWGFVPRKNIISKVIFCYWKCSQTPK